MLCRVVLVLSLIALASCSTDSQTEVLSAPSIVASTVESASSAPTTVSANSTTTTEIPVDTSTSIGDAVQVEIQNRTFTDPTRTTPHNDGPPTEGRTLPTWLWLPVELDGDQARLRPLIMLAHGSNGEPDRFNILATAWASAGFVVAAPRFPASSTTAGAGRAGISDMSQQPADVTRVIDGLLDESELRVDPDRIGMSGLSLGGSTVYALTTDPCCRDPRIKAAAVFDGLMPGAFGAQPLVPNEVPVLILHCDGDPTLPYEDHAVAGFARMDSPAWLVTMPCNEHSQPYEDNPSAFDQLVIDTTLDLWEAVLHDEPAALSRIVTDVTADGRAKVQTK